MTWYNPEIGYGIYDVCVIKAVMDYDYVKEVGEGN